MTLHFAYPHLGVLTIDHIIPRVAGGTDRYDNLVTCCFDCNNCKGNRTVAEFLRELYATGQPPPGKAQQQLRWRVVRGRGSYGKCRPQSCALGEEAGKEATRLVGTA